MKKLVFFSFVIIFLWINLSGWLGEEDTALDYEVIPDEAIRLRILANSDAEEDQDVKHLVRDRVSEVVSSWVEDMDDIDEARSLIQSRLSEIEALVRSVLEEAGEDGGFTVDYGTNIAFPMKLYGEYLYPPGEYEAILITIGEGAGSNWWCVLFPPLCFLDFSFGTTVEAKENTEQEEEEEEEKKPKVKFFLLEWFGLS